MFYIKIFYFTFVWRGIDSVLFHQDNFQAAHQNQLVSNLILLSLWRPQCKSVLTGTLFY